MPELKPHKVIHNGEEYHVLVTEKEAARRGLEPVDATDSVAEPTDPVATPTDPVVPVAPIEPVTPSTPTDPVVPVVETPPTEPETEPKPAAKQARGIRNKAATAADK